MGFIFYTNVNTIAWATSIDIKDTIARVVMVFVRAVSVMKSYKEMTRIDVAVSNGIENI